MVKVEPMPFSDCRLICPPKRVTSSWVMDSPKPVPSMPCASLRRVKALNTFRHSSEVMPMPVSSTFIIRWQMPADGAGLTRAVTVTFPFTVYLMALSNT